MLVADHTSYLGSRFVLWHISEPLSFFQNQLQLSLQDQEKFQKIHHPAKQLEFYAGRLAASISCPQGINFQCRDNDPPLVSAGHLSISHTHHFAAGIYHAERRVGVDVEYAHRDTTRIQKRFLADKEISELSEIHTAIHYWCAKEAIYKAGHQHGVHFAEHIYVLWTSPTEGVGALIKPSGIEQFQLQLLSYEDLVVVTATLLDN